jgi:hypothetical protein
VSNFSDAHNDLVARVLEGDGKASRRERRSAFDNSGLVEPMRMLISKVAERAYIVTDEDIAGAQASGHSEDQIFEMVICAAIGQGTRQYKAALSALDAAEKN